MGAAATVADRVLAGWLLRGNLIAMRGRVPDEHFEFRGGSAAAAPASAARGPVTGPEGRDHRPAQGDRRVAARLAGRDARGRRAAERRSTPTFAERISRAPTFAEPTSARRTCAAPCSTARTWPGADVTLANLAGASFRNAILADARLQAVTLDLSGPARTDFRGAELTRVNLKNSNLSSSTFADAEMRRIDLTHVDLSGSDLSGANLTEANFSYSTLRGADLSYAMLVSALFNAVDLAGASLRHTDLTFAVLNGAELADADFSSALLSQTVIARCPSLSQARGLDTAGAPDGILHRPRHAPPRAGHLPDELLARMGVDGEQLAALRSASSGAEPLARAGLPGGLISAVIRRQQVGRHAELTQLLSHPVQDARFESELAGTRRADLEMLLDQVHLGMGQPPVEEVVESAERLFARGPIQGMAHSAAPA